MASGPAAPDRAGLQRVVPAGLVDAACASLASFVVGLYAARFLSPSDLGTYALFFTAFITAAVVPAQLLFLPAEIRALRYQGAYRLRLLDQSLRLGSLPTLGAASAGTLAAVAGSAGAHARTVVPLALTTLVCTTVSPVQDHVRRLLHMGGRSWRASAMSVIQLLVTVGALLVLGGLGVPRPWLPLGALSLANVVSLTVGIGFTGERRRYPTLDRLPPADLFRFGRWLMLIGLTPALARFVSGVLVTHLAGPATLGYVEAARVVSQPLYVLMLGLSAVMGPRLLEAAADGRVDLARRVSRPYQALILGCGVAYAVLVAFRWPFNPLPWVLPAAYVASGVVPTMILAQLLQAVLWPARCELTGAGRGRTLLRLEVLTSGLLCLVSATARVTGALAVPLGGVVQGGVGLWVFGRARARIYDRVAVSIHEKG